MSIDYDSLAAIITGHGPTSTVPDNPDAIDAAIYEQNGSHLCDVTLLPDHHGKLNTWGSPDNWCSDPEVFEDLPRAASAIVAVVTLAHGIPSEPSAYVFRSEQPVVEAAIARAIALSVDHGGAYVQCENYEDRLHPALNRECEKCLGQNQLGYTVFSGVDVHGRGWVVGA